jgi:hypothetical protein
VRASVEVLKFEDLKSRFRDLDGQVFFFFFRPKLSSSTDRVFFLPLCPSEIVCSTLHPSDVGFFTSFNGEDLATFTSCSIFKTFVPTYYLSTCLVELTLFAFAGHVMDGWMNECQAKCRTRV